MNKERIKRKVPYVARTVLTLLHDDIDGSKASETITFGLDGVTYEIDLSARNAARLRKTLAPFEAAARRAGGRSTRRASTPARSTARTTQPTSAETPVDPATVRAWASAHRITVSTRGRIPAAVVAQFRAAGN